MMGIWLRSTAKEELQQNVEKFADELLEAKAAYQQTVTWHYW